MRATSVRILILIALILSILSVLPTAAAHGSVSNGVPGWVLLFASVLGLWGVIGGSVIFFDRLLHTVFGI